MNIADALRVAAGTLKAAGVAESAREARSLLSYVLQRDASYLIAHPEANLAANEKLLFESCVRRRAKREPFQYITGRQEFYGLDFIVTPDVLIPRPETEILVEAAIETLAALDSPEIFEIGVGSGCISISILRNVENARGTGVDVSEAALAVAQRNSEMHGVASRLEMKTGDLFEGIDGCFDLISSNPPYVPDAEIATLQPEVRDFEPLTALSGGEFGLDIVERIVSEAPRFLKSGGVLLLEIGFAQSDMVADLFDPSSWHPPTFLSDLQGISRIVKARVLSSRSR
jgi:release factor glutamine methyltransferase